MMKKDIETKTDIELMIRSFYSSLLTNDVIRPVFEHTDFEAHMPQMIAFWSFVLLDEEGYKTNVFDKHVHLPIKEEHFDIWLSHFEKTIDEMFEGAKAEMAKARAQSIAYTFRVKLKNMGRM
ncbi:MAG: group III truncated hemoglobin [Bacteroidia bacterium]